MLILSQTIVKHLYTVYVYCGNECFNFVSIIEENRNKFVSVTVWIYRVNIPYNIPCMYIVQINVSIWKETETNSSQWQRKDTFFLYRKSLSAHTAKSFQNLIKSTWNQIVFTIFRLIWMQTDVRLEPNRSEYGKYYLISGWFNKISKRFVCVQLLDRQTGVILIFI